MQVPCAPHARPLYVAQVKAVIAARAQWIHVDMFDGSALAGALKMFTFIGSTKLSTDH